MNRALRKPITAGEEDSMSSVWPSHLHLRAESGGNCCLLMSKLDAVSHNDTKSVSLLRDVGWRNLLPQNVFYLVAVCVVFQRIFIIIIMLYCGRWSFELEVSAAGKRSRTGAGQESWNYEQRGWYFPTAVAFFFFSDSALLFSSCPSDSHRG